jgi:hypothetical protein
VISGVCDHGSSVAAAYENEEARLGAALTRVVEAEAVAEVEDGRRG